MLCLDKVLDIYELGSDVYTLLHGQMFGCNHNSIPRLSMAFGVSGRINKSRMRKPV